MIYSYDSSVERNKKERNKRTKPSTRKKGEQNVLLSVKTTVSIWKYCFIKKSSFKWKI